MPDDGRELATLDEDTLSGGDESTEELRNKIVGLQSSETEDDDTQTDVDGVEEIPEEPDTDESDDDEPEEDVTPQAEPDPDPTLSALKEKNASLEENVKLLRQALGALQNKGTQPNPEPEKAKEKTSDEHLIEIATDPKKWLSKELEPYKRELAQHRDNQALTVARNDPEFRRLEPVIKKLQQAYPEDVFLPNASPLVRYEAYLHIASGLERRQEAVKKRRETDAEKKKRSNLKKQASALPRAKPRSGVQKPSKSIDKMSAAELKALIQKVGG